MNSKAAAHTAAIHESFALQAELAGGRKTGFKPYMQEGELYFRQRWMLTIGM